MVTQTCGARSRDTVWNNEHQCDEPADHDGAHQCLCGHAWPKEA
jgi:hypothetical protein